MSYGYIPGQGFELLTLFTGETLDVGPCRTVTADEVGSLVMIVESDDFSDVRRARFALD